MSYKALTVVLQLGCSNAGPLGVADDLARRLDAPVTGIARAQPMSVLMGDNFYAGNLLQADDQAIEAWAKAAETEFRIAIGGPPNRLQWSMAVTSAPPSESIASAAMSADLLITGISRTEEVPHSIRLVDVANLIEMAGRPVLVVPHGIAHFGFRGALIAWKERREARRAVADALPLLRLMERVVVVEVTESAGPAPAGSQLDGIATWLRRHGVSAVPRREVAAGDAGERLLAVAEEERSELIVAGAYGHSRYREWVMGGVTRTLLSRSHRCLLMSH